MEQIIKKRIKELEEKETQLKEQQKSSITNEQYIEVSRRIICIQDTLIELHKIILQGGENEF